MLKDYSLFIDKVREYKETKGSAYSAESAHPFRRNGAPFRFKLSSAQIVSKR